MELTRSSAGTGGGWVVVLFVLLMVGSLGIILSSLGGSGQVVVQVQQKTHLDLSGQVAIRSGLKINSHAAKHDSEVLDAWKIYAMLLEGQCVASTVLCGGSEIEKLYLCRDPSGLIGGLFVIGDEISTGYGARLSYWEGKLGRWEICE